MKPVFVFLALAVLAGCGQDQPTEYQQSINTWHDGRIERLAADDGWLTLVGLHPLPDGESMVGTAETCQVRLDATAPTEIGTLDLQPDGIRFVPVAGASVTVDGVVVSEPIDVATDADGAPTIFRTGTVNFHVLARGDRHFLRVKDNASPVRRDFQGVDRFAVDEAWRVTARLESEGMPPTVPIANVLGQVDQQPSPGVLVFDMDGKRLRLIPVGEAGKSMFIVFGDASNGHDTYGGGRFLSADPPDAEGNVVLDFNKATNPPCSFTPYATCPMPPRENLLPVAVTAGEKAWGAPH